MKLPLKKKKKANERVTFNAVSSPFVWLSTVRKILTDKLQNKTSCDIPLRISLSGLAIHTLIPGILLAQ